jgi:hypothetical protein
MNDFISKPFTVTKLATINELLDSQFDVLYESAHPSMHASDDTGTDITVHELQHSPLLLPQQLDLEGKERNEAGIGKTHGIENERAATSSGNSFER